MPSDPVELLIARHGKDRVGFDLAGVREVVRMLLPSALPGAPPGVLGVANLRGEPISVIDLEARLPAGASAPGLDHHLVVVDGGSGLLAVAVTRIEDIVVLPAGSFRSAPGILPDGVPVEGIARIADELVPVIAPSRLLSPGEVVSLTEAIERMFPDGAGEGW